jgi:hypothetical protein
MEPNHLILTQLSLVPNFHTSIQLFRHKKTQLEFEDEPGPNPKPTRNP